MKTLCILLFLPLVSFCSEKRAEIIPEDSIGVLILEKVVHVNLNGSYFEFTVILSNLSDKNFILYAFDRGFVATAEDSVFRNVLSQPERGAGNAMLILDKSGNRQRIEVDDCDDCEEPDPVSHRSDFLAVFRDDVRKNYLEATEVLIAKSRQEVKVKVEFREIKIAKGEYQFYMIYYCGNGIDRIIGEQTINEDEKKHKALAFRGWTKSNTIKLIVQ